MAKILIVEDNEMNRDMLSRRLARRGYEIAIRCIVVDDKNAPRRSAAVNNVGCVERLYRAQHITDNIGWRHGGGH